MNENKNMEQRLRRTLTKHGYVLRKSRKRTWSYDDQGGYRIDDLYGNTAIAGIHSDFDLNDVAEWVECNC